LISKHFIWSESGWAGGVYQWETLDDAKVFYSGPWREGIVELTLADGTQMSEWIKDVRGKGLLVGIDLDRPAGPVVDACRDRGLLVLTAGDAILRMTPPLVIDEADVDEAVEVVEQVLVRSQS